MAGTGSHAHPHGGHRHAGHGHTSPGHGDHPHDHHHDHRGGSETRLRIALIVTTVFMLVEGIGGWLSGSLALIADAVHMLTDAAALTLALFAMQMAQAPADSRFSYGRGRFEVLAAFVNGLALLLLSTWIIVEAIQRLIQPTPVEAPAMLIIAALGFAANLAMFLVLRDGAHSLNMRSALLHVLGDLLGSAAAIAAAIGILLTGVQALDPALSAVVAALILRGGWRVTRESAHILLEGTPADIDAAELATDLVTRVDGVTGIHHLHAWSLTDRYPMLTLHAVLAPGVEREQTLAAIQARLRARFGEVHATVQIERSEAECGHEDCGEPDPSQPPHAHAA